MKTLNSKKLPKVDRQANAPLGPSSFEETVDKSDLVVAGRVKDLTFLPFGTLTTFQVDRTAKGEPKDEIFVMQRGYIYPENDHEDNTSLPKLVYDDAQTFLHKGDRAVLLLRKAQQISDPVQAEFVGDTLGGAPVYYIHRGSGEYRSEGGKVRAEKPSYSSDSDTYRQLDGKSEDELMEKAEARGKSTAKPAG